MNVIPALQHWDIHQITTLQCDGEGEEINKERINTLLLDKIYWHLKWVIAENTVTESCVLHFTTLKHVWEGLHQAKFSLITPKAAAGIFWIIFETSVFCGMMGPAYDGNKAKMRREGFCRLSVDIVSPVFFLCLFLSGLPVGIRVRIWCFIVLWSPTESMTKGLRDKGPVHSSAVVKHKDRGSWPSTHMRIHAHRGLTHLGSINTCTHIQQCTQPLHSSLIKVQLTLHWRDTGMLSSRGACVCASVCVWVRDSLKERERRIYVCVCVCVHLIF